MNGRIRFSTTDDRCALEAIFEIFSFFLLHNICLTGLLLVWYFPESMFYKFSQFLELLGNPYYSCVNFLTILLLMDLKIYISFKKLRKVAVWISLLTNDKTVFLNDYQSFP